jgi:hypothetical protein
MIEPVAKTILGNWNLAMNTDKTELTHLECVTEHTLHLLAVAEQCA